MAFRKRVNQAELSRILGVSHQAIAKMKPDPSFPAFDKTGLAEIYAVCVWWYLRKEANPIPADEQMLAGDDSDGLERFRQARAGQEEIKLAKLRSRVVLLDDFEPAVQLVLSEYRRIAEHCKRTNNTEMMDMIEEANANVSRGLDGLYGPADTTIEDTLD
jgi:hypothetical protein